MPFRAAYWISTRRRCYIQPASVLLTDKSEADLPDDQLLAVARAAFDASGMEMGEEGEIVVGEWEDGP